MQTRLIQTDGLKQQVLEAGEGPLVLLVHGFPELSISWRAQVQALADAGYHAVAPDMRGYGATDKPEETEAYSILHLVGDMVDLVRTLSRETGREPECVVVGHDWGAPVAWHCALMRPDVFRAVFGLSVPFQPRRAKGPPTPAMAALSKRLGKGELYMNQFQATDAHLAFEADVATALRKGFYAYDGATPDADRSTGFIAPGHDFLSEVTDAATVPPWMSADQFAEYVQAFSQGGFKGPMDWYRCLDLNWSLTAFLQDKRILQPAFFLVGERDPVRQYAGQHEAGLKDWLTDLRGQVVVPGAGHWLQQERPSEVNAALLGFLGGVFQHRREPTEVAALEMRAHLTGRACGLRMENREWVFDFEGSWIAARSLWRAFDSNDFYATSGEGPRQLDPAHKNDSYAAPTLNEILEGQVVTDVQIAAATADLRILFTGGFTLEFVVSALGHSGAWAFGPANTTRATVMGDAGGVTPLFDAEPFNGDPAARQWLLGLADEVFGRSGDPQGSSAPEPRPSGPMGRPPSRPAPVRPRPRRR